MENKTPRYALFCCEMYYPGGGLFDLKATSDDIDELKQKAKSYTRCEWFHIAEGYTVILTAAKESKEVPLQWINDNCHPVDIKK
jgi:hypothetical protein